MQVAFIDDESASFTLFCAVIDDNQDFRDFFKIKLEGNIDSFKEVSEFQDNGYDVVFTDLKLYETFGVDTIYALKKKTNAPIVVLTGLSNMSASEMKIFLDAGAKEVWSKERINDPAFLTMVQEVVA